MFKASRLIKDIFQVTFSLMNEMCWCDMCTRHKGTGCT